MAMIPRATWLPNRGLQLEFPYHRAFIEQLKIEVPAHARSYDPATKRWVIDDLYAPWVVDLFRRTFADGRVDHNYGEPAQPQASQESGLATVYSELFLLPGAPAELVAGAYKCLAKLYHPDRGGDAEKMRRLNQAYSQIGVAS